MNNLRETCLMDFYSPKEYIERIKEGMKLNLLRQVVDYDNFVAVKFKENFMEDPISMTNIIKIDLQFIPVYERSHVEVLSEEHYFPKTKNKTSLWKGLKNCWKYLINRNNHFMKTETKLIEPKKVGK